MEEKILTKEELTLALDEFGMGFLADNPQARQILPILREMNAMETELNAMQEACEELDNRITEQYERTMETAQNLAAASSFLGSDSKIGKVTSGLAAATAIYGMANAMRQENEANIQRERMVAKIRAKRMLVAKEKLDKLLELRPKVDEFIQTTKGLYTYYANQKVNIITDYEKGIDRFKKSLFTYAKTIYMKSMLDYFTETYSMWMQYVDNDPNTLMFDDVVMSIIEEWRNENLFEGIGQHEEIPIRTLYVLSDPNALRLYIEHNNNIATTPQGIIIKNQTLSPLLRCMVEQNEYYKALKEADMTPIENDDNDFSANFLFIIVFLLGVLLIGLSASKIGSSTSGKDVLFYFVVGTAMTFFSFKIKDIMKKESLEQSIENQMRTVLAKKRAADARFDTVYLD